MKNIFIIIAILLAAIGCMFEIQNDPEITAEELQTHISYLASDELQGRFTGTEQCSTAAVYIQTEFETYGLKPLPESDFIMPFPFIAGLELAENNSLQFKIENNIQPSRLNIDHVTMPFSGSGKAEGKLVFAGYGISAPKLNYDDYKDIDVMGKIVVVMRYSPEYDNPHSQFEEYSSYRHKAAVARDKGAAGIIFVNGFQPKDDEDKLIELKYDRGGSITDFPAVQVKRYLIDALFETEYKNFSDHQLMMTEGKNPASFEFKNIYAVIETNVKEIEKESWNVAGCIEGSDPELKNEYIVIGAHFDHLGMGEEGSLYRGKEPMIHNGADDNASGTSGILELAEKFASLQIKPKRSLIFAAFSGEELGLLGSSYFVNHSPIELNKISAMINLDMIGRLNDSNELIVYGAGTSPVWKDLLNDKNTAGFKLAFNDDGYGPSDHSSFYIKNIPVLFFFTGTHGDYHRPSDDADKINYKGEQKILNLVYNTALEIANAESKPEFVNVPRKEGASVGGWKVYVGTIPDYASTSEGFKISGVTDGSPAQKAGLQGGDIMLSFGGKTISNIYDYVYALKEFVPGDTVEVVVLRNNEKLTLNVELGAR